MRTKQKSLLVVLACLAAAGEVGFAREVQQFSISHVRRLETEPPAMRVFLDVAEPDGSATPNLRREQVAATLGQGLLGVLDLRPFSAVREGVAYVFLVDVSKSLTDREFGEISAAMNGWIGNLGSRDKVAMISFGDEVRLISDWTGDFESVRRALAELGPTENRTLLHEALAQAVELGERQDASLPGRRVAVVLSDGRDEGSGLELEDVLVRFRRSPLPVYSIGFSRLAGANRRRYLDVLRRLATNTGGAFYEASRTDFAAAYYQIGRAIERVWVCDLDCGDCTADGSLQRLQIVLRLGDKVFTEGFDVRLLPLVSRSATLSAPVADPSRSRDVVVVRPGGVATSSRRKMPSSARFGFWTLIGLAAILLGWAAVLAYRRRRHTPPGKVREARLMPTAAAPAKAPPPVAPVAGEAEGAAPLPPDFGPSTVLEFEEVAHPPSPDLAPSAAAIQAAWAANQTEALDPTTPRLVRFHIVRGQSKGRQMRCVMKRVLVVGSRSNCDLVIPDEPNLDGEQFEIEQDGDTLFLRNLSARRPTLVNGLPLGANQTLQSGDLIGNGDVILRFMIGGG